MIWLRKYVETWVGAWVSVFVGSDGFRSLGDFATRGRGTRLQCRATAEGDEASPDPGPRSALGRRCSESVPAESLRTGIEDPNRFASAAMLLLLRSHGSQQLAQLL